MIASTEKPHGTAFRTVISSAFLSLALLALSPANLPAQAFGGSTYKAEAAIMSAGSRAAAVSRLKAVPSVGVVNLNIRWVPTLPLRCSGRCRVQGQRRQKLQRHQANLRR